MTCTSSITQAVHAHAWYSGQPLIRFNYISTHCSSVSCIKAARQSLEISIARWSRDRSAAAASLSRFDLTCLHNHGWDGSFLFHFQEQTKNLLTWNSMMTIFHKGRGWTAYGYKDRGDCIKGPWIWTSLLCSQGFSGWFSVDWFAVYSAAIVCNVLCKLMYSEP